MSITASIAFKVGAPPETFTFRSTATDNHWRFLADEMAVVLVPVCDQLARPAKSPPLFDRLDVEPCPWISDLKPGEESSDAEKLSLNPAEERSRAEFLYLLAMGRTVEQRVTLDALRGIRFQAAFHNGENCQIVYLADCATALLTDEQKRQSPSYITQEEERLRKLVSAANRMTSAADDAVKQIRTVNSEVQASTGQLAEVAQPFREMYKDQRLAGAKADALKSGIPELVVDTIVSLYHSVKLPTTDGLVKHLNNSGFATKLESAGHGTSRATVGRWLADFKNILRCRGIIQDTRQRKAGGKSEPANYTAEAEHSAVAPAQSEITSPDTRTQELPEGSDGDEH